MQPKAAVVPVRPGNMKVAGPRWKHSPRFGQRGCIRPTRLYSLIGPAFNRAPLSRPRGSPTEKAKTPPAGTLAIVLRREDKESRPAFRSGSVRTYWPAQSMLLKAFSVGRITLTKSKFTPLPSTSLA